MTLDDFKTLIRAYVPGSKVSVVTETVMEKIINKGVDDINSYGNLYKKEINFNATAETSEYSFSSMAASFLKMDKEGVWWNSGSALVPAWKQLIPVTKKYLDTFRPNWREAASGDPEVYYTDQELIRIFPTPAETLTNGFLMYYIKKAAPMAQGSHYPFTGSTTELTALSDTDDAIIDYVRWKLSHPLGKDQQGIVAESDYIKVRTEKIRLATQRLDVSSHQRFKMRIPLIGKR